MKINPRSIDRFLNNQEFKKFKAILLYGNNIGLVQQYIDLISKKISEGEDADKLKFKYADIAREPELLLNEIKTTSFFGSKKIILISEISSKIPKQLEKILLEEKNSDVVVIFYGSQLVPRDNIRKFFETSQELAIIACYLEEAQSLERKIFSKLQEAGVQIENPQAIKYIASNMSGDSASIETELDKLISFHNAGNKISNKDIKNIISKVNSDPDADKYISFLVQEIFLSAEAELEKLILSGVQLSFIVRALSRYFTKLYLAHGLLADGVSESEVPSKLKPPIFFKNIPTFKIAMKKYSASKVIEILEALLFLEIKIKSNESGLAKIIFEKDLFDIFTLT
jgi:DNA polymerase-3 subunit delta